MYKETEMSEFSSNDVGSPCQSCPSVGPENTPPPEPDDDSHCVESQLVHKKTGKPIPGEEYLITLPDGVEVRGHLSADGTTKVTGIENPGDCKFGFPKLDGDSWRRS